MCRGWLPGQLPELWSNTTAGNALGKQALSLGKHSLPQNLPQGPICKQSGISILRVNALHQMPAQPSSKAEAIQALPSWADSSTSPDKQPFLADGTLQPLQQGLQSSAQKTTGDLILPT